jgi:hypothetical protein
MKTIKQFVKNYDFHLLNINELIKIRGGLRPPSSDPQVDKPKPK